MTLRTITFDDEQWQVVPKVLPDALLCQLLPVAGGNSHQAERVAAAMADRLALQSQWRDVLAAAPEPPAPPPMTAEQVADLVARLRTMAATGWHPIGDEAANEIERLRAAQQPMTADLLRENEALRTEVERLRADAARLDWLDQRNAALNARYGTVYRWKVILSPNIVRLMVGRHDNGHVGDVDLNDANANGLPSCRDAIDEAMREHDAARSEG